MDSTSEQRLSQVNPTLANIVRQMAAQVSAQGGTLRVISGLRTYEQQAALYRNRANNRNPVAAPGTSKHEQGLAVDLSWSGVSQSYVGQLGESFGLRWGGRFNRPDPGHFELGTATAAPDDGGGLPDWLPVDESNVGAYVALGFGFLFLLLLARRL
jgi:peptidoglycan LD-endopeptidase CwlK